MTKPEKPTKIAYKVLRTQSSASGLFSAWYWNSLEYGQTTKAPEGTKLFVFKSLECARDYALDAIDNLIYEVEARGVSHTTQMAKRGSLVEKFWQNRKNKKSNKDIATDPPRGTMFADEIRLIRRVH